MPKNINNFSTKELEEELAKRQKLRGTKPVPLEEIDLEKLKKLATSLATSYIDYLEEHRNDPKGYMNDFYEFTLEAIYGEGVWDWINSLH